MPAILESFSANQWALGGAIMIVAVFGVWLVLRSRRDGDLRIAASMRRGAPFHGMTNVPPHRSAAAAACSPASSARRRLRVRPRPSRRQYRHPQRCRPPRYAATDRVPAQCSARPCRQQAFANAPLTRHRKRRADRPACRAAQLRVRLCPKDGSAGRQFEACRHLTPWRARPEQRQRREACTMVP